MFYRCSFDLSFFFRRLFSEVALPIATKLCHMVDGEPDFWNPVRYLGGALPPEIWRPQNIKLRRDFGQLRLQNATSYRQSQNGVANYGHSRIGNLNTVHFGTQTAKSRIGVLTHPPATVQKTGINKSVAFTRGQHAYPTSGRQAGHWRASSFLSSAAGDNYQAMNTLAPGKVERMPYCWVEVQEMNNVLLLKECITLTVCMLHN